MAPYLSAAGHDSEADTLEARAARSSGRYDPGARLNGGLCRDRPIPNEDVCWTTMVNPTERHLARAEEHRKLAEEHRRAARSLRDAEERACAGISGSDRDESLFDHREDILRVDPLVGGVARVLNEPWTEGVVVTFKPVPGMSVGWLQHVIDCHVARYAALGNVSPEAHHLLVPKGVRGTAAAVAEGFTVTVRAPDRRGAEELFQRADVLNAMVRQAIEEKSTDERPVKDVEPSPSVTPPPTPPPAP